MSYVCTNQMKCTPRRTQFWLLFCSFLPVSEDFASSGPGAIEAVVTEDGDGLWTVEGDGTKAGGSWASTTGTETKPFLAESLAASAFKKTTGKVSSAHASSRKKIQPGADLGRRLMMAGTTSFSPNTRFEGNTVVLSDLIWAGIMM